MPTQIIATAERSSAFAMPNGQALPRIGLPPLPRGAEVLPARSQPDDLRLMTVEIPVDPTMCWLDPSPTEDHDCRGAGDAFFDAHDVLALMVRSVSCRRNETCFSTRAMPRRHAWRCRTALPYPSIPASALQLSWQVQRRSQSVWLRGDLPSRSD